MSVAGGGAAQGGGSSAVIIDIMANSAQLGAALQDAEKQIAASAARMGKSIDGAMQQAEKHARDAGDRMGQAMDAVIGGGGPRGGPGAGAAGGTLADRIAQTLKGHQPIVQQSAMIFGESLAMQMNKGMDKRVDVYGTIDRAIEAALKEVPHWAAKMGTSLAERLKPYGNDIGRELSQSILDSLYGTEREAEFEEGTHYGLGDYFSDVLQWRNPRSDLMNLGRVRKIANQNLILGRMDELAALQAEQQILNMSDVRGRMIQSRMHMGLAEVQTSMGTFRTGFGTPQEASARVYDAAIKQIVALERIESIVKEIGHYSRTAMRN